MNAEFLAVLDACVLAPAALRDTLLRFAEEPRLYIPRWSEEIISEMVRTFRHPDLAGEFQAVSENRMSRKRVPRRLAPSQASKFLAAVTGFAPPTS